MRNDFHDFHDDDTDQAKRQHKARLCEDQPMNVHIHCRVMHKRRKSRYDHVRVFDHSVIARREKSRKPAEIAGFLVCTS
jgi:hypothetical protein